MKICVLGLLALVCTACGGNSSSSGAAGGGGNTGTGGTSNTGGAGRSDAAVSTGGSGGAAGGANLDSGARPDVMLNDAGRIPCGTTARGCNPNGGAPICDLANNRCVECLSDGDCTDPMSPHCDPMGGTCEVCVVDAHCSAGQTCVQNNCQQNCATDAICAAADAGTNYCNTTTSLCVECLTDPQCGGNTPFCALDNTCVQCRTDVDCPAGRTCTAGGNCRVARDAGALREAGGAADANAQGG